MRREADAGARLQRVPRSGPGADPIARILRRDVSLSIAVVSGKGGVGKTNLVVNLAVAMADMGQRVLLMDGDWGLASVDTLLGLAPRQTLHDVLRGRRRLEEIVLDGPPGVRVLPASSGIEEMADLDDYRRETLLRALHDLVQADEVLLIDTGSGVHRQSLRLAQIADEILVVTTPEPPAFTDAGATLTALAARRLARHPRLVVNMTRTPAEGRWAARHVHRLTERSLGFAPELIGVIPADETVRRAVREQRPFVQIDPDAPASRSVRALAGRLLEAPPSPARDARAELARAA